MSHSHYLECRLQKACHLLEHERVVVGQQDTRTIPGAFRLRNFCHGPPYVFDRSSPRNIYNNRPMLGSHSEADN